MPGSAPKLLVPDRTWVEADMPEYIRYGLVHLTYGVGHFISFLINNWLGCHLYPFYSWIMGLSCDLDLYEWVWKVPQKPELFHDPDPVRYIIEGNSDGQLWGWNGPGWYYWDEIWMFADGPFPTEAEARKACHEYCLTL